MMRPLLIASLGLALGAAAFAQAPPAAKSATLMVLAPSDIDPARLLPPPPAPDSDTQKAELAQLHLIQTQRTQARFDQALWDDRHQNSQMYAALLGPRFDLDRLPATRKVMQTVNNDLVIASRRAKTYFKRPRPWLTDPSLQGCPPTPTDPLSSYPSGHTTYAFATGVVLAELMPDKAQAILARDQDFADSRMVCGLHYRSDLAAGETLGTLVGRLILASPKTQPDLAAARAELRAAGLAP
jgi:acid phosphatase (class A)